MAGGTKNAAAAAAKNAVSSRSPTSASLALRAAIRASARVLVCARSLYTRRDLDVSAEGALLDEAWTSCGARACCTRGEEINCALVLLLQHVCNGLVRLQPPFVLI